MKLSVASTFFDQTLWDLQKCFCKRILTLPCKGSRRTHSVFKALRSLLEWASVEQGSVANKFAWLSNIPRLLLVSRGLTSVSCCERFYPCWPQTWGFSGSSASSRNSWTWQHYLPMAEDDSVLLLFLFLLKWQRQTRKQKKEKERDSPFSMAVERRGVCADARRLWGTLSWWFPRARWHRWRIISWKKAVIIKLPHPLIPFSSF